MRRRSFIGLAFVFSVFLLAVVSFSEAASMKSGIVGKWFRVEGHGLGEKIEFLKDGTFIDGKRAGDYRFIDDNRLRIDGPMGQAIVFEVSFDNAWVLSLKMHDGEVVKYADLKSKEGIRYASNAFNSKAFHLFANKQYDEAIDSYDKAIELEPDDAMAYQNRAAAYSSKGQVDRAIDDYNKVIALVPKRSNGYVGRGLTYARNGLYDSAINDYNKALALAPDDLSVYTGFASIYSLMGNEVSACEWLNKAVEKDEKSQIKYRINNRNFDNIRNSNCYIKIMDSQ